MEGNILNDRALYDHGDDWRRNFEVIPERLFEEVSDDADMIDTAEKHEAWIREV